MRPDAGHEPILLDEGQDLVHHDRNAVPHQTIGGHTLHESSYGTVVNRHLQVLQRLLLRRICLGNPLDLAAPLLPVTVQQDR